VARRRVGAGAVRGRCRSERERRRAGGASVRAVTQRKPVACAGVERSARRGRWRRGWRAREWLGRGKSRPRWREHACASAGVTRQGRANTVRQLEAEEQLHSVQGDDVQEGRARYERSCNAAAAGGTAQGAVELRVEDVESR
jgi:hypothetical protein